MVTVDKRATAPEGPGGRGHHDPRRGHLPCDTANGVAVVCGPPIMSEVRTVALLGADMRRIAHLPPMEKNMSCGRGQVRPLQDRQLLCCKDGPVFTTRPCSRCRRSGSRAMPKRLFIDMGEVQRVREVRRTVRVTSTGPSSPTTGSRPAGAGGLPAVLPPLREPELRGRVPVRGPGAPAPDGRPQAVQLRCVSCKCCSHAAPSSDPPDALPFYVTRWRLLARRLGEGGAALRVELREQRPSRSAMSRRTPPGASTLLGEHWRSLAAWDKNTCDDGLRRVILEVLLFPGLVFTAVAGS